MSSIPVGTWAVERLFINGEMVVNNESVRAIQIFDREWVLQPTGQRFKLTQLTANSAVLESNGETFYAEFEIDGNLLDLQLSRANRKEVIRISAEAITADVFVDVS